MLQQKANKY